MQKKQVYSAAKCSSISGASWGPKSKKNLWLVLWPYTQTWTTAAHYDYASQISEVIAAILKKGFKLKYKTWNGATYMRLVIVWNTSRATSVG